MASILEKVLRVGEGRTLRRLENYAAAINALEDDFQALSDDELKHETVELRERYANGESLDDLLPEAFAAVREASVARSACATSTCSSWAAPRCTSATSPR